MLKPIYSLHSINLNNQKNVERHPDPSHNHNIYLYVGQINTSSYTDICFLRYLPLNCFISIFEQFKNTFWYNYLIMTFQEHKLLTMVVHTTKYEIKCL